MIGVSRWTKGIGVGVVGENRTVRDVRFQDVQPASISAAMNETGVGNHASTATSRTWSVGPNAHAIGRKIDLTQRCQAGSQRWDSCGYQRQAVRRDSHIPAACLAERARIGNYRYLPGGQVHF